MAYKVYLIFFQKHVCWIDCLEELEGGESLAGKRRKKQKNRILRLFILAFIVYAGYIFTMQQLDIIRFNKIEAETQKKNQSLVQENNRLNEQLKDTLTLKFTEKMAREKLGLVKPGEILYINKNKSK